MTRHNNEETVKKVTHAWHARFRERERITLFLLYLLRIQNWNCERGPNFGGGHIFESPLLLLALVFFSVEFFCCRVTFKVHHFLFTMPYYFAFFSNSKLSMSSKWMEYRHNGQPKTMIWKLRAREETRIDSKDFHVNTLSFNAPIEWKTRKEALAATICLSKHHGDPSPLFQPCPLSVTLSTSFKQA